MTLREGFPGGADELPEEGCGILGASGGQQHVAPGKSRVHEGGAAGRNACGQDLEGGGGLGEPFVGAAHPGQGPDQSARALAVMGWPAP